MNNEQRKAFWNVLCNLPGGNQAEEAKTLADAIQYPSYIARYRPVTVQSIHALRNNRLFFSRPFYYDDPFDSFLHIEYKNLAQALRDTSDKKRAIAFWKETMMRTGTLDSANLNLLETIEKSPDELIINIFIEQMKQIIQPYLQKASRSICFTESDLNEAMWMKYADQHRGFCLIYDLSDDPNYRCDHYDGCKTCDNYRYGTPLYPVFYSDERYDATEFALQLLVQLSRAPISDELKNTLTNHFKPWIWESTKISLIKSKCHEHDQEWRILSCPRQSESDPNPIWWIPSGVVLGLRMEASNVAIVIDAAKSAGIKHIYEAYIDDTGKLSKREITREESPADHK